MCGEMEKLEHQNQSNERGLDLDCSRNWFK